MCESCETYGQAIEVTEENAPYMLTETTAAAMHACTFFTNGWLKGARGLFVDMQNKWQATGVCRMAYVWASALFFLPRPDGAPPLDSGYSSVAEGLTRITGETPDDARVAHIVVTGEQATAMVKDLAETASKGELQHFAELLSGMEDSEMAGAVLSMLMGEAGYRMRHARDMDDRRGMELFMAHVHADMPDEDEEDSQEAPSGAQSDEADGDGPRGGGDDSTD